jgi:hypothetical protein
MCRTCGSNAVVGFPGYDRCLSCHACWVKKNDEWVRISDTPTNFRIDDE